MNDHVAMARSPGIALAGPDETVRTPDMSPVRTSFKLRSLTPSRTRSSTPTKFSSLSPTKFIKQVQRFASPGRRRMSGQGNNENCSSSNKTRNSSPSKTQVRQPTLTPLHRLAKHRLWDEIFGILQNEPEKEIAQWLQQCQTHHKSPILGGSALHVVLFYNPPLEIVNKLIPALVRTLDPQAVPEDSIDPVREQTPLHVAVAMGCDFDVVKRLATPTAAQTIDVERRLPLHWACTARPQPNLQVLQLLVKTCPAARRVTDQYEFTPLMIAQYHRASMDICQLLLPTTFLHPSTVEKVRNRQQQHPHQHHDQHDCQHVMVVEGVYTPSPPEDLPWEVTLGKSMGDISCLHMDERLWESKTGMVATKAAPPATTPTAPPTATTPAPAAAPTVQARAKRERRAGKRPKDETKIPSDSGHSKSSSSSSSKKSAERKKTCEEQYQTVEL